MTSRTTPVGILVVALAGLFALGCTAQTSAVFEALVDPARAPASSSEGDTADDAAESSASTWWPLPDGYRMELPAGWFGVDVDDDQASQFIDAVGATYPGLADRMQTVLGATESRVSAVALDPSAGDTPPLMLVLAQPMHGMRAHEIKQHVRKQIGQLPGLTAPPFVKDAGLPMERAWRYDYGLNDADLGPLIVRSYLFRYGKDAYLVNFIAATDDADAADSLFDEITESLRFGV
jgi:hypothetical protein